MTILIILLIFLFLLCIVKISNNQDLIKKKSKTVVDSANIKEAQKHYHTTKTALILFGIAGISLIVSILCAATDIETVIIDALSTDFIDTVELSTTFYLVPFYVCTVNEIIIQVHINEYLLKFFNEKEEELDVNIKELAKSILYKKPKPKEVNPNEIVRTNTLNEILDENEKQDPK